MTGIFGWVIALLLHPPQEAEMSERLAPPGWQGNYWGPEATKARHEGKMPPIVVTPHMARWDRWGRQVLRDGDIVFRLGDARIGRGYFPMSRFLARASNSKFSHTGIVAIEEEGPVVYDISRTSVARQPFCVWILDNIGSIGVKRLRPEFKDAIPQVVGYCHRVFRGADSVRLRAVAERHGALLRRDDRKGISLRRHRAVAANPSWGHGTRLGFSPPDVRYPVCLQICSGASPHI